MIRQLRQIARVVAKQVLSGRYYGLLRRIAEQFPQENGVYRHPRRRRCSDSEIGDFWGHGIRLIYGGNTCGFFHTFMRMYHMYT